MSHRLPKFVAPVLALALASEAGFISGTVRDSADLPIGSAVVSLFGDGLLPVQRTLSDAQGNFSFLVPEPVGINPSMRRIGSGVTLDHAGTIQVQVRTVQGQVVRQNVYSVGQGHWRLEATQSVLRGLPVGIYHVALVSGSAKAQELTVYDGRNYGEPSFRAVVQDPVASRVHATDTWDLRVRKAGYLRTSRAVSSGNTGLQVALTKDPVERRIDSVMALLTLTDKIGQMTQALVAGAYTGTAISSNRLGSMLSGGGDDVSNFDALQADALKAPAKIPILYGIDAVHGHAKWPGAVVLPHNIGIGATRDTNLVRRLGENTAREMWAGQTQWTFAPCLAVARDERWGRTYEGYGESPELAVALGSAYIRGLQGGMMDSSFGVLACAKHYMADGGTTFGTGVSGILDQGDAVISDAERDSLHFPPYIAAVEAGVQTVMTSYSSINDVRMHAHKALVTDTLKTNLGFDGFVISDWLAIEQLPGSFAQQVAAAINAGVDMAMEPNKAPIFIATLQNLVPNQVPQSRIDDAVRRILRVKFRSGLMDNPKRRTDWDLDVGSVAHRALAREAVGKSLVVLKNDSAVLPLPRNSTKIFVTGTHANNTGWQAGGWTLSWQGVDTKVPGSTSLLAGMQQVGGSSVTASGTVVSGDIVVIFAGEQPYAETMGDQEDLSLDASTRNSIRSYKSKGAKVVLILVSGRPLILGSAQTDADAIVAAWLPGSEGAGVADVLFGDRAPTGKLPCSWPASMEQIPVNVGDAKYAPLYEYGYGLRW